MHKVSIIGVSGQAGSGKDTVADHLVKSHRFVRVALADPLKRFGYQVFGFNKKQLWGPSHFRNAVDSRYSLGSAAWDEALNNLKDCAEDFVREVLGTEDETRISKAKFSLVRWFFWLRENHPDLSPRVMLQTLGTEWGRESVSDNIWIDYLLRVAKVLLHENGDIKCWYYDPFVGLVSCEDSHIRGVVVSDVRFVNEFDAIRSEGGSIIRVLRPATDGDAATVGISNHASESSDFSLDSFDFLIQNDKGLGELYSNVDMFVSLFAVSHH